MYTRCALAGGTFLCQLSQKGSLSPFTLCMCNARIRLEIHINNKQLNLNFLLAHRNRYSEGMDDGQKTPRGYPDINSYLKILCVFIFQTDGRTDGRRHTPTARTPSRVYPYVCAKRIQDTLHHPYMGYLQQLQPVTTYCVRYIRSGFMPHIVLWRCFFNLSRQNIGLRCCSLVIYFRFSCFSADC